MRENINKNIKRRLYAESMGRCMNPNCQKELFIQDGDIIEKAHIVPYCETADNSFENLVVLCPDCHTNFDNNHLYSAEEVLGWKKKRQQELQNYFCKKYSTFEELKEEVKPLLIENKTIYENYFLGNNKNLWDKFEVKVLINNKKLENLLSNNLQLIQKSENTNYSNCELVNKYLLHIKEFEKTRLDDDKFRQVLFPKQINSIFGIEPIHESLLTFTESLEELITKLESEGENIKLNIGCDNPSIIINSRSQQQVVYLDDEPYLRQLFYNKHIFKSSKVRFQSLNYILKFLNNNKIQYRFANKDNLREIFINDKKIYFIYEYCLGEAELIQLSPQSDSVIVNLHNWNGSLSISKEAYDYAEKLGVELKITEDFYEYARKINNKK